MRFPVFFITLILIFIIFFFFIEKEPIEIGERTAQEQNIIDQEKEKKLLDLTQLSERISKKILNLELSDINLDKRLLGEKNPNAYKEILNFEDTFQDIIPGDILTIDLFEEGIFQKEIKSVEKKGKSKIIKTVFNRGENYSFLVIGPEMSFGKIFLNNNVYLINQDRSKSLNYIIDTRNAGFKSREWGEDFIMP
ncbi:hypothetical protein OA078_00210 [Gammaproteobacteria bacterium]|nr:hypothetical protein [Gammaproteobacteria bacterium]